MSGLMRSAGVLLMILSTVVSAQTAQENLKKARTLIGKNKFAPGLKLVERAISEPGNDLETTLELLELQGVCNAALKKPAAAKLAFQKLMSLSPAYHLKRKGPAAVIKAYADAKVTAEALAILPTTPEMSTGRISEIAVEVQSDPHKLAKTIIFNYRVDGGKWKVRAVPAVKGRVEGKVDAADRVEWYATVLGANDAEMMRIRSLDAPITHTYQAPVVTPPIEAPVARDAPRRIETVEPQLVPADRPAPIEVVESGHRRAGWVAPLSVTLLVAGAAAGGVGTYFGFQSSSARQKFATATAGPSLVVGVTRQSAVELDREARTGAMIANTLWIAGGALLITGIMVAVYGPDEAAR